MFIHKSYRFRIYPTKKQIELIKKTIGCSRFVFNHFLATCKDTYKETGKGLTYHSGSSKLPSLKNEYAWLKEADSIALQSSLRNLADSFLRFYNNENNAPRIKSKNNNVQSYKTKYTIGNIAIIGNNINVPKLGLVRFSKSRDVEGRILHATVRRNPSGKYFISILVETEVQPLDKTETSTGIDLGITDFAILSYRRKIDNDQFAIKMEKKL